MNSKGFSHHFILPVLAIFAVGAIGIVTLNMSSAATTTESCTGKIFGRYKNNPAYSKYKKYIPCVKAIQKKVGISQSSRDGIYGDYTQKKVKAWQSKHSLYADGVVGPKTWDAMGIHPKYTVEVSTTKKYSYQKCTYKYYGKTYTVSAGAPPTVKCSRKTTTNRAIADNAADLNREVFNKRSTDVKVYNRWLAKRTGEDQKRSPVSQQSIKDALKIDLLTSN